jgi:hypothetical protein
MTYAVTDTVAGSQGIADNSTTQKHPLGTIVRAKDPTYGEGEFIYLKGVASTTVGLWVTYNVSWQSALATSAVNTPSPHAVAMSACVADEYGWYQIGGLAVASKALATSLAAGAIVATASGETIAAATSNTLESAVVAVVASANTTANVLTVQVMIDRPAGPASD